MAELAFDRYVAPRATAYHRSLANLLERREPDLWKWFASEPVAEEAAETLRLELLKRTYRLDRDAHAPLHAVADEIAAAMDLDAPVALYQSEGAAGRNAALYFEASTAHVVFEGDALRALDPGELRFVLGHELAHHQLWTADQGRFWTAYRLLRWAASQPGAAPAFAQSARLERLYTELFADRFGLWAVGDLEPALTAQVKLSHDAAEVSGAAFLAQAEEALERETARKGRAWSEGGSHPEAYLRAVLMAAWSHDPAAADGRARGLLEGGAPLESLDLLGQEHVSDLTFWLLFEFLTEPWASQPLIRAHAHEISDALAQRLDAPRHGERDLDKLRGALAASHPEIRRYFAYLLLDFASVDPQLEDVMLAAALRFSEDFGLLEELKAVASQELKTTKAKLADLEKNAVRILSKAELSLGVVDGEAMVPGDPTAADDPSAPMSARDARAAVKAGAA
ncbi:MAG: hypothetical protein AAF909_12425 [Pseudomonadota bacterium]